MSALRLASSEDARVYPFPVSGEGWDDPHRLARLFADEHQSPAGLPTLIQWRDQYHRWNGCAWQPVADSDLDAELARHCRAVFEADYPIRVRAAKTDDKPTLYKFSSTVRNNVRANLSGLLNEPDTGADPPFWLSGAKGSIPPASEVIAAPNGLFTLDAIAAGSGPFSDPTPAFFTPNSLPFGVPNHTAPPDLWLKCLDQWFSGDPASIAGLQEWFGYLLTCDTSAHKILLLVGPTRSGKGTILHILQSLVGAANVATTSFSSLAESFGLQPLLGKTVALIPDARQSGRTDLAAVTERLLSISGDDQQPINRKNLRQVSARLRVRFVQASNELPRLPDAAGAIANRYHILSTPNSWLSREDRTLKGRLEKELPAILLWAAAGYVRLRANGTTFTPNTAAAEYQRELADLSSPIGAFVRECCVVGPDKEVERSQLYQAWVDWNEALKRDVSSANIFGKEIRAVLPHLKTSQPNRDGRKVRVFTGVGLKPRSEWGDDDEPEQAGTGSDPAHVKVTPENQRREQDAPEPVPACSGRRSSDADTHEIPDWTDEERERFRRSF